MSNALRSLLRPGSIAIVGASADPAKVNGRPVRYLLRDGYRGRIYLVNPKYPEIGGLRCYPDVAALPEVPELGVVALPAEAACDALRALGDKGVKVAIVWSSGFAEVGVAGKRLEEALAETARRYGMRLCGPNTLGLTNAFERMPLTFSQYADQPLSPGPVAFVSQSGAFGTAVATAARERGIGLGYFVSTGNQADITVADVIDAVVEDEGIRVVVAYIEGLTEGTAFLAAAAKALARSKPVIVVKVGRGAAGRRAAVSHTGSVAGDDEVFDDLARQFGVLRANDEAHALDLTAALVSCPAAREGGLGLITLSGGAGVMMADLAEDSGLEVPVLSQQTQSRLAAVLRGFASTANPVDVTGQALEDVGLLARSLDIVLDDAKIGLCVLWIQLLHSRSGQLVDSLAERKRTAAKPFVVCWLNAPPAAVAALRAAGVCVAETTRGAIQAAAGLVALRDGLRRRAAAPDFRPTPSRSMLSRHQRPTGRAQSVPSIQAAALLQGFGLPLVPSKLASSAEEAVQYAAEFGYPVAVKVESPDILHKTEANGVRLNVRDGEGVRRAFDSVFASARAHAPSARIFGVLVQPMANPGVELALGLRRDSVFGSIVMVGFGGIFIEVLKDVAFAAPPIDMNDAREMIGRLKAQALLRGVRGKTGVNVDALAAALCSLSELARAHPEIVELDVNPLFGDSNRVTAVDWLMVKEPNG